jgi:LCP family protein required for cell wall assembly
MTRVYARKARSRSGIDRVTLIILIAFVIVASITAILAFIWARSFFSPASQPAGTASSPVGGKTGKANSGTGNASSENNVPFPSGPLKRANDPTPIPWNGNSRVTLLFMGLDYRDWTEGDIPRTDSMILFSIDPASRTAGMLSIPRDLWVNVPGVGYNKINTAYRWGEINNLPGGGPGLAMKTVEETLGVPVDYYALVDFNSFVKFIDELGGLDMKIREEIVIDPIGPGNTRTLEVGTQTLTGAEVLAYARNRYAGNDDFDRSRRQQEVIMAIRQQILQFDMLPTIIAKAPKLYKEISSGINTNLSLDQLIRLALLAAQINEKSIQKGVIGPPLQVEIATNPDDGQSILIPVPDQIRILRDQIFVASGPAASVPTAAVSTNLVKSMKEEKARVLIKNGTSTPGLASKASEILKSLGVNVIGEENADQPYSTTTIYEYTSKQSTIKFLIEKLNLKDSRLFYRSDDKPPADIVIILGSDWAKQQK